MAALALTLIGGAVGGALVPGAVLGIAGATWGMMAGSLVGNLLFSPDGQNYEGPRLNELNSGSAAEGEEIPQLWGHVRLAGQLIWLAPAIETKTVTESGGGKSGGSTTTTTTYSYRTSFAVAFGIPRGTSCKLRKLILNKKVYVDLTGASAVQSDIDVNYQFYDGFQVNPDTTIESYVGIGNAPAYKNRVYIVFNELDLTDKFGNNLPAVEVELAIDGTTTISSGWMTGIDDGPDYLVHPTYSPGLADNMGPCAYNTETDRIIFGYWEGGAYHHNLVEINPYTRTTAREVVFLKSNLVQVHSSSPPFSSKGSRTKKNLIWMNYWGGVDRNHAIWNTTSWTWEMYNEYAPSNRGVVLGESDDYVLLECGNQFTAMGKSSWTISQTRTPLPSGYSFHVQGAVCLDNSQVKFICGMTQDAEPNGYDRSFIFLFDCISRSITKITDVGPFQCDDAAGPVSGFNGYYYWPGTVDVSGTHEEAVLVIDADLNIIRIDNVLDTFPDQTAFYWPVLAGQPVWHQDYGTNLMTCGNSGLQYDLDNFTWIKHNTGWGGAPVYHHQTGTVFKSYPLNNQTGDLQWIQIYNSGTAPCSVASIVTDLCADVGIDGSKLDIQTSKTIAGFVHKRQATARQNIETILQVTLCEAVVSNWKLKIYDTGSASVVTIPYSNMAAREANNKSQKPLIRIEPEIVDIPRRVSFQYISADLGLQPSVARADWVASTSNRHVNLQAPVTFSDADAAELAKQFLQLQYESVRFRFSLPRDYAYLDPGDVITIDDENGTLVAIKLLDITRGVNDILECEGISENADNLTAYAAPGGSGYVPPIVSATSPSQLILLDTPLLRDEDSEDIGPYIAGYAFGNYKPSVLFDSIDDSSFDTVTSIVSDTAIGITNNVMTDVDWEDWDDTNVLEVTWQNTGNRLVSTTDANLTDNAANAIAFGTQGAWEIVQVGTVTPVDSNTDQLSHLLRGRRGTDQLVNTHSSTAYVVVLNINNIGRQSLSNALFGNTRYYRLVAEGSDLANVVSNTYVVNNEPFQPYTCSNPQSVENETTRDIAISATARARRYGSYGGPNNLTDGVGAADSHITAYRFQILDAVDGTELNTYDEATPSRNYTSAEQTADYGGVFPTVYWRVVPISDQVTTPTRYCPTQTVERPDIPTLSNAIGSVSIDDATISVTVDYP